MDVLKNKMQESKNCSIIAKIVMLLGTILGICFIFAFGQVQVENEYLESVYVWSGKMIFMGILIILNGFIFGYLLLKLSSILREFES